MATGQKLGLQSPQFESDDFNGISDDNFFLAQNNYGVVAADCADENSFSSTTRPLIKANQQDRYLSHVALNPDDDGRCAKKQQNQLVWTSDCQVAILVGYRWALFTPQPLRAVGVLFSPMLSGWAGGRASWRAGGWAGDGKKFVRAISQKP